MANELAQSFSLASHAVDAVRRTNLARDVSQADLSLRSLALGQQQQQLGQNAIRLQQEQQKINLSKFAANMDFLETVGKNLSPDIQKKFLAHTTQQGVQAGLFPEGATIEFPDVQEKGPWIQALLNQGHVGPAFDEVRKLARTAHPADLPEVEKIEAGLHKTRIAGKDANSLSNRKNSLLFSESEWAEHMKAYPDDRRRENQQVHVANDDFVKMIDAKLKAHEMMDVIPPEKLNRAAMIKIMSDLGIQVDEPELQESIDVVTYMDNANRMAEMRADDKPVPQSLIDHQNFLAARNKIGQQIPVEDANTQLARETKHMQNRLANARIVHLESQQAYTAAQIRNLDAALPGIQANNQRLLKLGDNLDAKTALMQGELLREQKRMKALAPQLTQERNRLEQEQEAIVAELDQLKKDPAADSVAIEKLGLQRLANEHALEDLDAQIAFAEAVGPDMFLEYERLAVQREKMEARSQKGQTALDAIKEQQAQARTEQIRQKMGIEERNIHKDEAKNVIAGEAARKGILDDEKAVTELIESRGFGKLINFGDIQGEAKKGKPSSFNVNFPTGATQTKAQGVQDEGSFALTMLDELEKTVETDTVGALGKLRGLVHGVGQQASAFGRKLAQRAGKLAGEIATGEIQTSKGPKPNTVNPLRFFDEKLTEFEMLSELAAYEMAAAIANQEGRGLSDRDVQNIKDALKFDKALTGEAQIKTTIKMAKRLIKSRLNIAADRLEGTPTATKPPAEDKPFSEMSKEELFRKLLGQ